MIYNRNILAINIKIQCFPIMYKELRLMTESPSFSYEQLLPSTQNLHFPYNYLHFFNIKNIQGSHRDV
jgi:hypothetical protein